MSNIAKPTPSDLPTSKQLLRSTLIALVIAIVVLLVVVLPAEYAIDPTGLGRALGLTEMGQIKEQLAQEAAADADIDKASKQTLPIKTNTNTTTAEETEWRDTMEVRLLPGQGAEVKLTMQAGEKAQFSWVAQGGGVNFDTHGDGGGNGESISYEKGRNTSANEGVILANFSGHHGWFWRNRGTSEVTIVIHTRGQYAEMKRVI